jgi:uncharacterized phiE125 gp8 family phage protein
MTNLRTVEPATAEPVTLVQARAQCKVEAIDASVSPPVHPDDDLLRGLITAAREAVENFTNTIMTDAVYEYRTDCFGGCILLPRGPVSDIDWVKYLDENEALQLLATSVYYLDDNPWQPVVGLKKDQVWPVVALRRGDAVRVQFSGGFYSPTFPLPQGLVQAMLLLIGHWYRNREDAVVGTIITEIPMGAKILMMPHRRGMGV